MFELSGKCALITGATGDIGAAIARTLHSRGARLVLSGTRMANLDLLVQELGKDAVAVPCDLSNADGLEDLLANAETAMGSVDILINNAGITRDNLAVRLRNEDWYQVIEVNLNAAFLLTRGVLKGMMRRRWGRIINISSVVGASGNAGQANYAAAKAGLIGMTKSLAQEVSSRSITVNCIAPGFIDTAMTHEMDESQRLKLLGKIPSGKFGEPEDIASTAIFLASDEARYITGQTLHVNGGMLMI